MEPNEIEESDNDGELALNEFSSYGIFKFSLEPDTVIQIRSHNYFPPEVINLAIDIYYQIATSTFGDSKLSLSPKILKGAKKTRRIYICFYKALNDIGLPMDPHYLALHLNLPKTDIAKAFNETPLAILTEPEKLIPFYLHQIERTQHLTHCLDWLASLRDIPQGQEYIDNMPVKSVCLGIIIYGLNLQRKELADLAPKCFSTVPYMSQCQKGIQACFEKKVTSHHDLHWQFWWLVQPTSDNDDINQTSSTEILVNN